MQRGHLVTALDIGTDSIKGICAAKKSGLEFEIVGRTVCPSFGMRRGIVIDPEEVSKNIKRAVNQLEEETARKISDVYININGYHLFSIPSHGSIIVSRADQKISREDVERVIQESRVVSLPLNKEILDVFPKEFIVDGERGIKDVSDMRGMKLEVESLAIGVFSPYFKNLTNAVLSADLQILNVVPSPLASERAVLTPRERELGVILIDIGAGTSSLAVFKEGSLIHMAVIPIGSANITHDIAVGLKIHLDAAEKIKREFGTCVLIGSNKKRRVEVSPSAEELFSLENDNLKEAVPASFVFSPKMLVNIIEPRVSEIFEQVLKEVKKVAGRESFPAGVVIIGGGAKMPKLGELARKELKLPVRIGVPRLLSVSLEDSDLDRIRLLGQEKDPLWSTACGLALLGIELEEGGTISPVLTDGFFAKLFAKLKKLFRIFIP